MKRFSIAVIPGDGAGLEVTPQGLRVLQAAVRALDVEISTTELDWGSQRYFSEGSMMPGDGIQKLEGFDAILLGAIGHPRIQDNVTLNGLLLPIRRAFDQYACVRPAKLYSGVPSPLAGAQGGAIDMVIVRENTEGEYAQIGGRLYSARPGEVAVQTSVFTRAGVERIIRFAFELAMQPDRRRKVTSITKSNAQGFSMVLWDETFRAVAMDFPDVETESLLVDAATIHFVQRPESFDVVVASNLFGDILSDLSAALTGSIGLAPSANLDPLRRYPSMFEPVHGSAPDIEGQGVINPVAMILSVAMMLDWLGLSEAGRRVEQAVARVLAEAKHLPRDLGGTAGTTEVGDAVVFELDSHGDDAG